MSFFSFFPLGDSKIKIQYGGYRFNNNIMVEFKKNAICSENQ